MQLENVVVRAHYILLRSTSSPAAIQTVHVRSLLAHVGARACTLCCDFIDFVIAWIS